MHIEYNLLLPKLSQYEAKHKTKVGGANCFQRIKLVTAAKHSVYHQEARLLVHTELNTTTHTGNNEMHITSECQELWLVRQDTSLETDRWHFPQCCLMIHGCADGLELCLVTTTHTSPAKPSPAISSAAKPSPVKPSTAHTSTAKPSPAKISAAKNSTAKPSTSKHLDS